MQRQDLAAIILAAGQGKRMQSDLAKVLHPVLGRPMLAHVLDATREAGVGRTIVIVGHQADRVRAAMAGRGVEFALQAQQKGTGHAVQQAAPLLADHTGQVLVLCGDTPLLTSETLLALLATHRETGAAATMDSHDFANWPDRGTEPALFALEASHELRLTHRDGCLKALWQPIKVFIFPGRFEPPKWQSVLEAMHALAGSPELSSRASSHP